MVRYQLVGFLYLNSQTTEEVPKKDSGISCSPRNRHNNMLFFEYLSHIKNKLTSLKKNVKLVVFNFPDPFSFDESCGLGLNC